jgi:signal transduction histidine kinase
MKQRIAELGGELHIDSDPGGTCVKASLPTKSEVPVEEKSSAAD